MELAPSAFRDAEFELVRTDTLRFFPDLVAQLGGDPQALLRQAGVDPAVFAGRGGGINLRAMVELLELAAAELKRPDFGMRLAALQGGRRVFGPIGVVMRNSRTLGEAFDYVVEHVHAYSLAARIRHEVDAGAGRVLVRHDLLLDRLASRRQIVEQTFLLGALNAIEITGGRARPREVLFRHRPLAPLRTYREHFGCEVRFDQPLDGMVYTLQDLACPIPEPDPQLHEMATSFIETEFSRVDPPMHAQVRGLILQRLGGEGCTNDQIAAELGLHPRTLHRRLKAEGTSFEGVKDEVRRDVAQLYLQETDLPLTCIAEKLGYAETSVLSRSCARWFGVSPRRLRARAGREG